MVHYFRRCIALAALSVCALAQADDKAPVSDEVFPNKFISLGTSSSSGTFFPVGSKVCAQVNRERSRSLVRCVPYRTVGSDYNAKAVAYGELVFGMTSPELAQGLYRNEKGEDPRGPNLRAVMALHSTPALIIARKTANVADTSQMAGHSINIGNLGSGQRLIMQQVIKTLGLTNASFTAVTELHTTQMGDAFCAGKVDIIMQTLGNPAPFYRRMIEECGGQIVPMTPDLIEKLLAANPLMVRLTVPGGLYAGQPDPVQSVGYRALLVSSSEVSDEAVYRFVSSLMTHFEDFRRSDPVLQDVSFNSLFKDGIVIPLHNGVERYLKQHKN